MRALLRRAKSNKQRASNCDKSFPLAGGLSNQNASVEVLWVCVKCLGLMGSGGGRVASSMCVESVIVLVC